MATYYHIALPVPRSAPFTYLADTASIPVGTRVLVPLGRRVVTGVVVQADVAAFDNAKSIIEVLDDEPAVPPVLVQLTQWIGSYYLCAWGEALEAALPTGLTPTSVFYAEISATVTDADLETMARRAPKRAELLAYLQEHDGPQRVDHLQKELGTSSIAQQLDALQHQGLITVITEVERERGPRTVRAVGIDPALAADEPRLHGLFDELDKRAPKQSLALGHLYIAHRNGTGATPLTALANQLGVSVSVIDALIEKGLATVSDIARPRDDEPFDAVLAPRDEASVALTSEQRSALHAVVDVLQRDGDRFHPFLLEGVTGSGKTVVYQRAMQQTLELGRSCLMLVPEIALTPQLHDRFRAVFGDRVALLHSRMAIGERIDTWRKIRRGDVSVVIGARSAVFAPLTNVGLIVVDEEHEPSYKQDDPAPRYHGRDTAVMRAALEQCPVILGSATPSLESLQNAAEGRYHHLRLTHRADTAQLPTVRLVDLRQERKAGRLKGSLSSPLLDAIRDRLRRSEGTILFLNRRGYASAIQCEDCGAAPQCPNCDVSLTWHKTSNTLACHYCGHREARSTACTVCGSLELHEAGVGTQRVEEDLRAALEGTGAVIERMDTDSMHRRGAHRRLLQRFASGDVDVVIGTQMVAKGLDLPRVTLIGVVNADQTLYQSDFRASERTAQLLTQVAGRAGRDPQRPGEVLIQTSSPDHPAIAEVLEHDQGYHRSFVGTELAQRREAGYPPFSRFMTVEINGPNEAEVEHVARVIDRLLPTDHPAMQRYAPVAPTIARLRNRYRRLIVIRSPKQSDPNGSVCRGLLSAALLSYHTSYAVSTVRVTVDIDANGSV